MNRLRSFLALTVAVSIAACGGGRREGPAVRPTTPPALPAAETWRPPADGRLTPRQVELYIGTLEKVRDARARRPTPEALPSLGAPVESMPDVAVGRAVFGTSEQYLWVKERVLEAEGAQLAARLSADELALLSRTLADLRARREKAADEGSRRLLSEQIANFETEADRTTKESKEREPEAVRANMRTLEPYRARLSALGEEIRRAAPAAAALAQRTRPPAPKKP